MSDDSTPPTGLALIHALAQPRERERALLPRLAFELAQPAALALSEQEIVPLNVDLKAAVLSTLGALPKIMAYREQAARSLADFDARHFDNLELYAKAAAHADTLFRIECAPPEALPALGEQARALRDLLYADASVLARHGLIGGSRLQELKTSNGYLELAVSLLGLACTLRNHWSAIAAKCAVESSDLDLAEDLSDRIIGAVARRDRGPSALAQVTQQRLRYFTLFARSFAQVRRALTYLRWEEQDVERIAPSLYRRRKKRARRVEETESAEQTENTALLTNSDAEGLAEARRVS